MFPRPVASLFLLTALALSIGWGIRGNFGHEFGALLPGALAGLTAMLLSGRPDWHRRAPHFAFLGALGWSFGGSISYMQVIAYTHSGHSGTIAYGFACLFVIGLLWAAIGGAGTALPAVLTRERLTELYPAILAVFVAWIAQTAVEARLEGNPDFRQNDPLYWYDTDWLAATTALLAVGLLGVVRRRWDAGCSLVTHMAVGWWLGFALLVLLFGLRMTPPRGDNWAGCTGMVLGLWFWLHRQRLPGVLLASLVAGIVGGLGFSGGALFELIELKTGWHANWHSVLEQSYGAINGLGIALAVWLLRDRTPVLPDAGELSDWTDVWAGGFVLAGIPWLNLQKNVEEWVRLKIFPATMYGLPAAFWFHSAFGLGIAVVFLALARHRQRPVALLSGSPAGRAQLLVLALLWLMVLGNFERALGSFQEQRLITEGVIHLNAVILTAGLLLLVPATAAASSTAAAVNWPRPGATLRRTALVGIAVLALAVAGQWGLTRALYGDQPAGMHRLHIRFGPNATATKEKPKPGEPHP